MPLARTDRVIAWHAGGRENYDTYVRGSNIVKEAGSKPREFWACDHTADCTFPEADCPDEDTCPHKISNPPWGDSLTEEQARSFVRGGWAAPIVL